MQVLLSESFGLEGKIVLLGFGGIRFGAGMPHVEPANLGIAP